jgi:PAS domain S-box-containing protein
MTSIPDSALLQAIVESSEDAIVAETLDGRITAWNPGARRLLGYESSDAIGQPATILVPEHVRAAEQQLRERVLAGERIRDYETQRITRTGDAIDVSCMLSPIRDATGALLGLAHVLHDIGRRRGMERDVNRLAAIVDSSDDAIVSKNLDGIIQTWNKGAERMFGYTAAEAVGRSIRMIIPDDRQAEEDEVLARIRSGQRVDHFDTIRRRKDGTLIPISLSVSPVYDGTGKVIGASKIARDLSALRAYATTLEQTVRQRTAALEMANTQLEAFAYSVSHDLRAPLRGMHGLAHALLEDYGPQLDERARDYARRIVEEAQMLDRLIQDLLAYSRLTRIEVSLEPVDVADVVDEALRVLSRDLLEARATVEVEADLPSVRANRAVLVQVFTNLISNAVKFSGPEPIVRVRADRSNGTARIWVEDQGIGIAPQHHERIFRAFERLHGVEEYPGTGIGLAIVHKGIERLGGRVGVESNLGAGSRFWFELSRTEAA